MNFDFYYNIFLSNKKIHFCTNKCIEIVDFKAFYAELDNNIESVEDKKVVFKTIVDKVLYAFV